MSDDTSTPTPVALPAKTSIEEVKWTDDIIRWEGGLRVKTDADEAADKDDDSSDDEDYMVDPFADPDPFEIFHFQFQRPSTATANGDGDGDTNDTSTSTTSASSTINIQIRGYKKDADQVWQSTGLTLWRASDYLCQYQMEHVHDLFENKRILELGAGLGLNGILAWRSTATTHSQVCITDGDSDALVHLRENVERNRNRCTTNDDEKSSSSSTVSCNQLIWGKESSSQFLEHVANNETYDVILASDVIYAPVIVVPLWETIVTLLKRPSDNEESGVFVMAYARRKVPVSIELVCEKAVENGFVYELVKEDDEEGIWVYTFRFEN